jgi:hypothetical protein
MTTTPPNLTKIDFSDIKTSLTDYLKNQTTFVGYNFEGSAIQTIIDLLAYNTYYYAFYSNLLAAEVFLDSAQRTKSIVSLVKPLGYTVPGLKSAQAKINVSGSVQAYTSFPGIATNGSAFAFYNLQAGGTASPVTITEGILVDRTISSEIDLTKQKYIIPHSNVDISTIDVTVTPASTSTPTTWKNVNYFPNDNDTIFYIERNGDLFEIHFGKENNLGKSILASDTVQVRYLRSSGSQGNGIVSFSNANGLVASVVKQSSGGNDEPDLDVVKFIAPRVFSGQDRAITKGDYAALLIRDDKFTDEDLFVVYGGNELDPPKPGRIFVSYEDIGSNPPSNEVIEYLRKKNPLALIPEYVIPKKYTVTVSSKIVYRPGVNGSRMGAIESEIQSLFQSLYSNFNFFRFSRKFNFSELKELVLQQFSSEVSSFEYNKTTIQTSTQPQKFSEFYLENALTENGSTILNVMINGSPHTVRLPATIESKIQPLEIYNNNTKVDLDVGRVLMSSGYIRLNKLWSDTPNLIITNKSSVMLPVVQSLIRFNPLSIER